MDHLWLADFETALATGVEKRLPVIVEFMRPNCAGCLKMEHEVFSDAAIQKYVSENFVPLRQNILANRAVRSRYAAIWTPSFYFLNFDGKLLWFVEGALSKEDFLTICTIGRARYLLHKGRYAEAIDLLDSRLTEAPNDVRAAQLVFIRGMAYYLRYGDKDAFHAAMEEIVEKYPHSPEARMWPWEQQYPLPPGYGNP
jgi:tetratricopeptide (TPR) repeat protein